MKVEKLPASSSKDWLGVTEYGVDVDLKVDIPHCCERATAGQLQRDGIGDSAFALGILVSMNECRSRIVVTAGGWLKWLCVFATHW